MRFARFHTHRFRFVRFGWLRTVRGCGCTRLHLRLYALRFLPRIPTPRLRLRVYGLYMVTLPRCCTHTFGLRFARFAAATLPLGSVLHAAVPARTRTHRGLHYRTTGCGYMVYGSFGLRGLRCPFLVRSTVYAAGCVAATVLPRRALRRTTFCLRTAHARYRSGWFYFYTFSTDAWFAFCLRARVTFTILVWFTGYRTVHVYPFWLLRSACRYLPTHTPTTYCHWFVTPATRLRILRIAFVHPLRCVYHTRTTVPVPIYCHRFLPCRLPAHCYLPFTILPAGGFYGLLHTAWFYTPRCYAHGWLRCHCALRSRAHTTHRSRFCRCGCTHAFTRGCTAVHHAVRCAFTHTGCADTTVAGCYYRAVPFAVLTLHTVPLGCTLRGYYFAVCPVRTFPHATRFACITALQFYRTCHCYCRFVLRGSFASSRVYTCLWITYTLRTHAPVYAVAAHGLGLRIAHLPRLFTPAALPPLLRYLRLRIYTGYYLVRCHLPGCIVLHIYTPRLQLRFYARLRYVHTLRLRLLQFTRTYGLRVYAFHAVGLRTLLRSRVRTWFWLPLHTPRSAHARSLPCRTTVGCGYTFCGYARWLVAIRLPRLPPHTFATTGWVHVRVTARLPPHGSHTHIAYYLVLVGSRLLYYRLPRGSGYSWLVCVTGWLHYTCTFAFYTLRFAVRSTGCGSYTRSLLPAARLLPVGLPHGLVTAHLVTAVTTYTHVYATWLPHAAYTFCHVYPVPVHTPFPTRIVTAIAVACYLHAYCGSFTFPIGYLVRYRLPACGWVLHRFTLVVAFGYCHTTPLPAFYHRTRLPYLRLGSRLPYPAGLPAGYTRTRAVTGWMPHYLCARLPHTRVPTVVPITVPGYGYRPIYTAGSTTTYLVLPRVAVTVPTVLTVRFVHRYVLVCSVYFTRYSLPHVALRLPHTARSILHIRLLLRYAFVYGLLLRCGYLLVRLHCVRAFCVYARCRLYAGCVRCYTVHYAGFTLRILLPLRCGFATRISWFTTCHRTFPTLPTAYTRLRTFQFTLRTGCCARFARAATRVQFGSRYGLRFVRWLVTVTHVLQFYRYLLPHTVGFYGCRFGYHRYRSFTALRGLRLRLPAGYYRCTAPLCSGYILRYAPAGSAAVYRLQFGCTRGFCLVVTFCTLHVTRDTLPVPGYYTHTFTCRLRLRGLLRLRLPSFLAHCYAPSSFLHRCHLPYTRLPFLPHTVTVTPGCGYVTPYRTLRLRFTCVTTVGCYIRFWFTFTHVVTCLRSFWMRLVQLRTGSSAVLLLTQRGLGSVLGYLLHTPLQFCCCCTAVCSPLLRFTTLHGSAVATHAAWILQFGSALPWLPFTGYVYLRSGFVHVLRPAAWITLHVALLYMVTVHTVVPLLPVCCRLHTYTHTFYLPALPFTVVLPHFVPVVTQFSYIRSWFGWLLPVAHV